MELDLNNSRIVKVVEYQVSMLYQLTDAILTIDLADLKNRSSLIVVKYR